MADSDDQNNSRLRVTGYGPRLRQTLIIVGILGVIAIGIVLATIWANSRDPEVGIQPTPRPTQAPRPTATDTPPPTDTATPEPTEPAEVLVPVPDTATPVALPEEDTPTPTAEALPSATPAPEDTVTPVPDVAPTAEPSATAIPTDTPTPIPPTVEPVPTATDTPTPRNTATPTLTPTPAPTATPTVTPTPQPMIPTTLEIYARGQLIEQGIDQSDVSVLSVEEHSWPDSTLGCGYVKGNNVAKTVEGWILQLGNDEKIYTFHIASADHDANGHIYEDIIANCTDIENRVQTTVNLVHELRLHEARRFIFYRDPPDGDLEEVADVSDPTVVQVFVDALNVPIPIGNMAICETAYRIDFYVLRGIETVKFFCREDIYRVGGDQEVWQGTQGAMPQALLDAIAPILASKPLPALPTFAPE